MGSRCLPGGTHPPGSEPKVLGWRHKSLLGWWSQPKRAMAPHVKIQKEKKKKGKTEVGRKRRTPPSQTELEESSSS